MAEPQLVINQVGFGDDFMEINYFETREQTDEVGIMRTLVVNTKDIADAREEILRSIEEVIDYALVVLRNPPKKKFGPGRLRDRIAPDEDE
jgi:hypothetical protein